ncbi:MAG: dual specificity protein phosphatase family protein [Nitrospirales bacterium]
MHYVTDSLLLGNAEDANNPPPFVNGLLSVASELVIQPPSHLLYAHVPLQEFARVDPQDLKRGIDWLERHARSNRIMVCCRAGMGRSASMVIAYLCCVEAMTYREAVRLVKARRPGATPLPDLEWTIELVRELRAEPPDPSLKPHAGASPSDGG